ncbi:MAG: hypothetical protein QXH07_01440 [Thermoplasmata archaeon]
MSDAFVERQKYLERAVKDLCNVYYYGISNATEDRDEFLNENIFCVSPEARWSHLMPMLQTQIYRG